MKYLPKSLLVAAPFLVSVSASHAGEILFIDSYHPEYPWSAGITKGVEEVVSKSDHKLTIHRMDTKRNTGEDYMKKASDETLKVIEDTKPDVIIACDDNASKYVVEPHLKGKDTPVVFCGLNWDASRYGFPADNVTGMIEVSAADELVELLLPYAQGNRIGLLSADTDNEKKELGYIEKLVNEKYKVSQVSFVKQMANFEEAFLDLQSKSDIIVVVNNAGIEGWNDDKARAVVEANAKVPVGTVHDWLSDITLASFSKIPEEQGQWAAQTALKILEGASPKDIPVARNTQGTLVLNARIAQKLNIELPAELIEAATKVVE